MTTTIPMTVLVQVLQALDGAFHTVPLEPLPPLVRSNIAGAFGRLEPYVEAILAAQKVEVTQ